jgi:hypothetical protein
VLSDQADIGFTGTWSDSGTLLITAKESCLAARPPSGGEPKPIRLPQVPNENYCWSPEYLPGNDDFIFMRRGLNQVDSGVYLASLRDGNAADPVLLLKNRTSVHCTPAGAGRLCTFVMTTCTRKN